MGESLLILGVSGLRGIVGESLTPEVAVRYAAAFGSWLKEERGAPWPSIGLAADGRRGWEAMHAAAKAGLLAVGCHVVDLGVLTTPTVGVVVDELLLDGAIQVTASHNPQEWNGLKCLIAEALRDIDVTPDQLADPSWMAGVRRRSTDGARAPTATEASKIIARFRSDPAWRSAGSEFGRSSTPVNVFERHLSDVWGWRNPSEPVLWTRGFTIVVDSVNASGCELVRRFAANSHWIRLIHINGDGSGVFPHTPEPTRENLSGPGGLCDVVPGAKADVGFAQDPDADRLAIVDETGRYIGEEYTLVLAAEALLGRAVDDEERAQGKPVIVVNLSTSRMVEDVAAKHGAEVVRTAVGEANVVERMKALTAEGRRVVMGGEGNGGVIWPEVTYVRDSLSAMALTLGLMARTGKTVSQLVADIDALSPGGKGYAIVKRKVEIARKEDAQPAVEAAAAWGKAQAGARLDLQDGCRVDVADWNGRGAAWVHVRASNTEPIMRLIAEAGREEDAVGLLAAVEGAIRG